jgi:prophage antirepressor-like protein
VCRCLDIYIIKSTGYPNVTRIKQQLGEAHFITQPLTGGDRVTRHTNYVDEPGLYKLIMRSDKDTARPFQDWVTKEVLPAPPLYPRMDSEAI